MATIFREALVMPPAAKPRYVGDNPVNLLATTLYVAPARPFVPPHLPTPQRRSRYVPEVVVNFLVLPKVYSLSCTEQANATDSCSASVFPRQLHRLNPDPRASQRTRHFMQRLARTSFVQLEGTACNPAPCSSSIEKWIGTGSTTGGMTASALYMNGAGSVPSVGTGAMSALAPILAGIGGVTSGGITTGCCAAAIPNILFGSNLHVSTHPNQNVVLVYQAGGHIPGVNITSDVWQGNGSGLVVSLWCVATTWNLELYYGPADYFDSGTPISVVCSPFDALWTGSFGGEITA